MFNESMLWKERFGRTIKELSRYLRYILNGHLMIVMVFLIGTAAYYYQDLLKLLPETFPVAIVMALCLAILLTYSPIYTFMSEADRVFLLPLETRLGGYFNKSIWISFFSQIYLLLLGLAVLMPLYAAVHSGQFNRFFPFLLVLLIVKWMNLKIRWFVQYEPEKNIYRIDSIIRLCVNLVLLYLLFADAAFYFTLVPFAILFGLFLYFQSHIKGKGVNWDLLIEQDERRMTSFYRLANLFTDVPKLKNQIKRRAWLDRFITRIPFHQDASFSYLFARTLFRSGDYWGLYCRLTIIGVLVLLFIASGIGEVILAVLFVYLTGFQLLPLWKHHQLNMMTELYPVAEKMKQRSFLIILRNLLFVQTLIFTICILIKGDFLTSLIILAAGIVFSIYFVFVYSKGKTKG